ncbi:MAG TPA: pyrroline-5-carboxylate reductase dimerization domain-containing protein, partial [Candidatus Aquilonibacter sp.]|nr:pyrroline-5-carboxylate reductase dimerization domain-containing protein [Candidatus Aquilonibacter sp.]
MRIGIIGHGTLGGALAHGLAQRPEITSIETTTKRTRSRNADVARDSDVVLLCVKPKDLEEATRSIAPVLTREHVLVSTAASVGAAHVRDWSLRRPRVVRAMPNTPARAGAAMTVIARDAESCGDAVDVTRRLFALVGRALVMEEGAMDAVTAISGCGPAFAFVVMEAMIEASIALGVPYERARELVAQTVLGSAALLLAGDEH